MNPYLALAGHALPTPADGTKLDWEMYKEIKNDEKDISDTDETKAKSQ